MGVGEMIWQLGALTAIAEDPDVVSGTHMVTQNHK